MPVRESPQRIEPCSLERYSADLADRVAAVVSAAQQLGQRLHPHTAASLADLVRVMNCYYSNLIEGHATRPLEIEQALRDEFGEPRRRPLQLEARAHIRVQRAIDARAAAGDLGEPASAEFIRWLHQEFYRDADPEALTIRAKRGSFPMVPGAFRERVLQDNAVGRHVPPSSAAVPAFMEHFEQRFRVGPLGKAARVTAVAVAHHRLAYIHPFPDGNGRVARLMSHAMAFPAGIGAHGLWSISRGLARGLNDGSQYRAMMDRADTPRRNDLDGRGNLSLEALEEFVTWFTEVMLDQLTFMTGLFEVDRLTERLATLVTRDLGLADAAAEITAEVLRRGELPRGNVDRVTGRAERTARNLLRDLVESGLLASKTPKGPVALVFRSDFAGTLFPRLLPAELGTAH